MKRLLNGGVQRTVQKGSLLAKEGQILQSLFYVEKGLLRVYYLIDGKEVTDWFSTEGSFITSLRAYYENQPSNQYIESLENSVIIEISKSTIENLCKSDPGLNLVYQGIITNHLIRLQERIRALQFFTAKERFELLLQKNREVVKKASRTHIASYLGISLETLSRISRDV